MTMPIGGIPIGGIEGIGALKPGGANDAATPGAGGASFSEMLAGLVNQSGATDSAVKDLSIGGDRDLHDITLAVELESMAFELAVEVRNKLVDAYNEIFRMSI